MENYRTKEKLNNCKECSKPIKNPRAFFYCTGLCRQRFGLRTYLRRKKAEKKPGDVKCLVCVGWYKPKGMGTHVVQRHGYENLRTYRQDFNLNLMFQKFRCM